MRAARFFRSFRGAGDVPGSTTTGWSPLRSLRRLMKQRSASSSSVPPPPPPPPPVRPYFDVSRYRTVFSKVGASLRYGLNRFQPFTSDHRLAMASWAAVGSAFWVVAGTSTFLSVVIFVIPSDRFQAFVAHKVSEHVTQYTGATVTFGRAIQPTWKTLRFQDVTIRRTEASSGLKDSMDIDLHLDTVDVKVSLLWMLEGRGLVESAHVRGVRGTLDRSKCWNEYDAKGQLIPFHLHVPVPPERRWRSEWYKGSFHLADFSASDVAIVVQQPEPKRPLSVVIHRMQSSRLRRQFLFYDLLCSSVDGAIDHRLFSLHPPPRQDDAAAATPADEPVHRAHFHMDGVAIDLLQAGGATGPLSWISRGHVDVDAMFSLPRDFAGDAPANAAVQCALDMKLANVTASVPLGDERISYLNAALVQPIVVFLNTNYVSIPLHANLEIPLKYFDGAWSPYAAAMTDALSEAAGVALSAKVSDHRKPKNVVWLIIMGVDGAWRAAKHGLYVVWHQFLYE